MLVLTRKPGEKVATGNGVHLTVVEGGGSRVRLAFGACGGSASSGTNSPAGGTIGLRPIWAANGMCQERSKAT
jgi:hypothetical protein